MKLTKSLKSVWILWWTLLTKTVDKLWTFIKLSEFSSNTSLWEPWYTHTELHMSLLFDLFVNDFSKVIQISTTRQNKIEATGLPMAIRSLQLLSQSGPFSHCHSRSGYDYWWWGVDKKRFTLTKGKVTSHCEEMQMWWDVDKRLFNTHTHMRRYKRIPTQRQEHSGVCKKNPVHMHMYVAKWEL